MGSVMPLLIIIQMVYKFESGYKSQSKGGNMNSGNRLSTILLAGTVGLFTLSAIQVQAAGIKNGEEGFKQYCAPCHPNGGNVMNGMKNLTKTTLSKNGIKSADDIIRLMRRPNGQMTAFDNKTLSDNDAEKIAEYVLKTFK